MSTSRRAPFPARAVRVSGHALLFVLLLVGQPWTGAQDARDPDEASAYKIGIQDQLMVSVYGEPDLTMSVPVRPDGRISLPLVQDIVVAGLSPMAAADRISERLDKLIKDPEVTVIVTGINSFPVYILGEVGGQGVFNFQRPIRLFQALATAGGINEYASGKIVVVRTKPDGTEERMEVDYDDYVHSREDAQNPYLKPGDTILVD